jgi:hypothetical protein
VNAKALIWNDPATLIISSPDLFLVLASARLGDEAKSERSGASFVDGDLADIRGLVVTTYLTVFHSSGATSDSASRIGTAQRFSRILLSVLSSTAQSSLHGLVFGGERYWVAYAA